MKYFKIETFRVRSEVCPHRTMCGFPGLHFRRFNVEGYEDCEVGWGRCWCGHVDELERFLFRVDEVDGPLCSRWRSCRGKTSNCLCGVENSSSLI
ncbi:unnamed protein product [Periconia digitata]|uniref:Uncharacterized protein n=1 Tax=Periconia digitata TaxID=1303443 RepID=A0A9W4UQE9_9PLEO|nr:unnamed protein product [Periconia digitata]